jgi:hypothetical protein
LRIIASDFAPLDTPPIDVGDVDNVFVLSKGGAVVGRVVCEDERPVTRCNIVAIGLGSERSAPFRETTDNRGAFRFERLPVGKHALALDDPRLVLLEHPVVTDVDLGTTQEVVLTAVSGPAIVGWVYDKSTNAGIADAVVTAFQPELRALPVRREITDEFGEYRMAGVAFGEWRLSARLTSSALVPWHEASRTIVVHRGIDRVTVDFELDLGVAVSGFVTHAAGAKRGRPGQRPGAGTEQAATTAYRNAMVGSVTFYGAVTADEKGPKRLRTRYTSHMPEEHAVTFKAKFEAELADAERKAPPDVIKVLLCDGARALWNYAENTRRFDEYEKIIDYCHTLEHLSLAAEALFGKGTPSAKSWYDKYRTKLLEEDLTPRSVLHSMDYYEQVQALPKSRRDALEVQRTFFRRNQARMTYADFRRRGLPIGSGPVEAACKTLVKTRLCRSGMRWTRKGGQRILDLRTYVKSNRWDAFWNEYRKMFVA